MATVLVRPDPQKFAVGASMAVYSSPAGWQPERASGPPPGTLVETQTVASDGTVSFNALGYGTEYVGYGSSPDRYWRFEASSSTDALLTRVAAVEASKATLAINAKDPGYGPGGVYNHGALGDGASHLLSAFFSTLAKAQVVYPAATALTQELNWAVIQKAIDTANAAGGGRVFVPRGTYVINSTLTLRDSVHLDGEAQHNAILKWTVDLGAGTYALQGQAGAVGQIYAPLVTNLMLQGPGGSTLGVQSCNMDGIALNNTWKIRDGISINFRAGLVMLGNHQTIDGWHSATNYYNVLYPSTATSYGNQSYRDCRFAGALFAAIAVERANFMDGCTLDGVDLGFAPYGIYKFDGPATANTPGGLLVESQLRNVSFEAIGNGAILDESTVAGSSSTFSDVEITYQGFSWAPSYKIAARAADYAVRGREVFNARIAGHVYPFTAGAIAAFHFVQASAINGNVLEIDGDVVASMFSPTGNFAGAVVGNGRAWKGVVGSCAAAVTQGQLVAFNSNYQTRHFYDENRALFGVAMTSQVTSDYVVVATNGHVQALCQSVPHGGVYLTPDEGATTVLRPLSSVGNFGHPGTGTGTPNRFPIAAISVSSGGSGGGGLMAVYLIDQMFDRAFVAPGAVSALPAASVTYRGQILTVEGGAGVADVMSICQKNASNVYVWRAL